MAATLFALPLAIRAEDPPLTVTKEPVQADAKAPAREQVHARELMTDEEFAAHRARMRAAKTREERQQIREEHRAKMQERAKERVLVGPLRRSGRRGDERPGVGSGPRGGPGPGGPRP